MSLRPYLGANVSPLSVEEMHHRGLLQEGETLLALFDGVLLDEQGQRVGGFSLSDFVALTDQRLITWARGFFNDTVDGIPWSDVDVVEADTWDPFHGRVRLAIRLPSVAPRKRRIIVKGVTDGFGGTDEKIFVNTLDYMPAEDVPVLAAMIGWVGDQIAAGVEGEALLQAFADEFPAPDRPLPGPMFVPLSAEPQFQEEPLPEPEPPKRRWWQFGKSKSQPVAADTPEGLVAAYERERTSGGMVVPARTGSALPANTGGAPTIMPEQPGMYDVSRALRLMLEMPRRMKGTLGRASQVVSGANELIGSAKDPDVRRAAITNLRRRVDQHEQEQGPLAPVAPVVRAVLRFGESAEDAVQGGDQGVSRRIQVRAAVRPRHVDPEPVDDQPTTRRAPEAPAFTPAEMPDAEETPPLPSVRVNASVRRSIGVRRGDAPEQPIPIVSEQPEAEAPAPLPDAPPGITVRRQINLRRVEPTATNDADRAEGGEQVAAEPPPVPDPPRIPVRRIVVSRNGDMPATQSNGNGKASLDVEG